jgi:hypothetical protein
MTPSLSPLLAAAQETTRELPMPPIAFGALAMLGFLLLLGVLWAFRGTANKIAAGNPHVDRNHPFHGDPTAGKD